MSRQRKTKYRHRPKKFHEPDVLKQCLHYVIPFGKYKGKTLGEIAQKDLCYLHWLKLVLSPINITGMRLSVVCEKYPYLKGVKPNPDIEGPDQEAGVDEGGFF